MRPRYAGSVLPEVICFRAKLAMFREFCPEVLVERELQGDMDSRLQTLEGMTLRQAVSVGANELAGNRDLAETAVRDAELLLLHALELPRSVLHAYPGRLLSGVEEAAYRSAIERRMRSEPMQYITGVQEFFGLAFEVGPGVLIPRPETELLVEAALDRLPQDRPVRVLDVGTGTGAIAIAVASRLPEAEVVAVDLSAAALAMARRNVGRHGLGGRVTLIGSDLLRDVPEVAMPFDAILSNPPYVPEGDRAGLHPQVRDYEPAEALFAGADGLAVYRRLLPQAHGALRAGGLLALEIGYGQREAIEELLGGWRAVQFLDDLQGIARVALGRRP